ncbi:MAG: hypothetical protein ABF709_05190 [Leuconostoc pseudomesenteroides]|uniref:hypothetical protein n=1 Tax=Leuconostoc pseudomesenteroides TaxID=33968 RepID=UPI001E63D56B|nr:hypothetical protein [Leuconostoc pseudomesenteroides]MCC7668889.1 hypothetical protein [Leuconostoc pseudomesenteroides]
MEEIKTLVKRPFVVISIILVVLLVIIVLGWPTSSDNNSTETAIEKNSSSDNDYEDYSDYDAEKESESFSTINNFSADSQISLANLKADVSTMPKENYDNIENSTLEKIDFDPTGNNPSASYQISAAMNSLKNVQKLADDAKDLANKPDKDYTHDDKNKLINYSHVLHEYLLAFKDYATITYHNKYTSEDPSTSPSDKKLLIDEMTTAKADWIDKKNQWLNKYNAILGN